MPASKNVSEERYHELASWVFDNFGKVIAQNTVSDIVRREEFWLATSGDAATLYKVSTAQYLQLKDALYLWFLIDNASSHKK